MVQTLLVAGALFCAFRTIRAHRLLTAALWLAGTSALLAVVLFLLGAPQVAVIELSVGAGLVTVLFVFAISIAGEDAIDAPPLPPRRMAAGLVLLTVLLIWWLVRPLTPTEATGAVPSFAAMFWEMRGLDALVQVVLIFAGVLALLGLLREERVPVTGEAEFGEREGAPAPPLHPELRASSATPALRSRLQVQRAIGKKEGAQ